MTSKRSGTFRPTIVKASLMQRLQLKWKKLLSHLRNLPKGPPSHSKGDQGTQGSPVSLRSVVGGKIVLKTLSKSTPYNPREFRADKGPRK